MFKDSFSIANDLNARGINDFTFLGLANKGFAILASIRCSAVYVFGDFNVLKFGAYFVGKKLEFIVKFITELLEEFFMSFRFIE